jgi:GAF domain-containing protein
VDFAWVVPAIMEAPSLRVGLARAAPGICEAFGVDRVSIFVPQAGETLIALLQHGLPEQQMLRIPAAAGRSIAGYVIAHRRVVNVGDVYDNRELATFDPPITHMHATDERTGFRTRQVLAAPMVHDGKAVGMVQLLNRRGAGRFPALDEKALFGLCDLLAPVVAAGPALARRDPFVEGASEAMRRMLEVPLLKAQADGGLGADAPKAAANAREKLLAVYAEQFRQSKHLDPFLREPSPKEPWTAGDTEALEWVCRLAASGHADADRLLEGVVDMLGLIEGDFGLRMKALAHAYPKVARLLARQEARRGDCDAQALLQWARLGGLAGTSIAEVSEELERRR